MSCACVSGSGTATTISQSAHAFSYCCGVFFWERPAHWACTTNLIQRFSHCPTTEAWVDNVGPHAETPRMHNFRPIPFQIDKGAKHQFTTFLSTPPFVSQEILAIMSARWPPPLRKGVERPLEKGPRDMHGAPSLAAALALL